MMIRCPKCHRMGYLPDRLASAAGAEQLTLPEMQGELPDDGGCRQGGQSTSGGGRVRGAATRWTLPPGRPIACQAAAPFLAEDPSDRFDEPTPPAPCSVRATPIMRMTFSIDDPRDESGDDWEKDPEDFLEPEAPSSDEIEAIIPIGAGSARSDSWFYGFIVSWGRPLCFGVLGFVAFSVLIIGFLVANSLGIAGSRTLPTSIQGADRSERRHDCPPPDRYLDGIADRVPRRPGQEYSSDA